MLRGRCCIISTRSSGTRNCWSCCKCRRTAARGAVVLGNVCPDGGGDLPEGIPIAGIAEISRQLFLGRPVICRAWRRIHTAPAVSCMMQTGTKATNPKTKLLTDDRVEDGEKVESPWKERLLSRARWCNGCATAQAVRHASEIEALAEACRQRGVYLVPRLRGWARPIGMPHARGRRVGSPEGHRQAISRALALEGTRTRVFDVLKAMERDAGIALQERG